MNLHVSPDSACKVLSGNLEVRLAETEEEVRLAQELRYRVFYEEMCAKPTPEMAALKRDFDQYDAVSDHLLVFDYDRTEGSPVVGTYRLIRREAADQVGGFYTSGEFDITALLEYPGELLELGRSCVDAEYRNRATLQLLWQGIAAYIFEHDIAVMFGCASLPGTEPEALAPQLDYLHRNHLAPTPLRARALPGRYVDMRLASRGAAVLDDKRVLAELPPLLKGYLRLGGFVGEGAVVDHQFNTTDVCMIVQTELVTGKYMRHYERSTKELKIA